MSADLEALKAEAISAQAAALGAVTFATMAADKYARALCRFSVGDIIEHGPGKSKRLLVVTSVACNDWKGAADSWHGIEVRGCRLKKDGTLGADTFEFWWHQDGEGKVVGRYVAPDSSQETTKAAGDGGEG